MKNADEKYYRVVMIGKDGTNYAVMPDEPMVVYLCPNTGLHTVSVSPCNFLSIYDEKSSPYTFSRRSIARKFMELIVHLASAYGAPYNRIIFEDKMLMGANPDNDYLDICSIRIEQKPDFSVVIESEHVFNDYSFNDKSE